MSRTLRNLVALSCVLMTGQALASGPTTDYDSRFYVSPSINATATDKDWGTNNGLGFGVGIGKAVSESWNLELNGNYSEQNLKSGSSSVRNLGYDVDAMYFFTRNPSFSPFVEAGVGGVDTHLNSTSSDQNNFAGNVGVGFMKWMNDIALRADIRYRRISDVNNNIGNTGTFSPSDWIASIGLVIPLGSKPVPPAPPAPEPAPAPAPAPQEAPPPPPAPEPVETPRPVAHTKIIMEGEHFNFNKATLRPSGKEKLDQNAVVLNKYPDINVDINGYTDSTGPAKYNLKLSRERATTVKKYLESKGIAANRMTIKGYGEKDPIATNKTIAGRAKNRRVEIEILN
ncbi:MAG: OmpA family protein [Sulfuriferula sp.]